MARKSKRDRQSRFPIVFLRRNDRIRVIACLDFCLSHGEDLNSTAAHNIDILRNSIGKAVAAAVRAALRSEYRGYGREDGDFSYKTFLAEGSAFLRYSADDAERLQAEKSVIQFPPRRGRNGLRSVSEKRPSTPAHSDTSSLSLHSTPDLLEGFDPTPKSPTPRPAKKVDLPSILPRLLRSSRGRSTRSRTVALSDTTVKEESLPAPRTNLAGTAETASPETPQSHAPQDQGRSDDGAYETLHRLAALERRLAERNEEHRVALESIQQQKDYIFTLSNRLSAAERECRTIKHSINKAHELQTDVEMQANLRHENSALRDQVITMSNQRKVIAMASADTLRPSSRTIRETFDLILTGLKDACSSVDITLPTAVLGHLSGGGGAKQDTGVERWSRRVSGFAFGTLISHAAVDGDLSDIHIITALVSAAMAELVFESSFPDFLARESPLLDQYRKHILSAAGPKMLSRLDLLACNSIVSTSDDEESESSYFQSGILTEAAKGVADTLASALRNVISAQGEPAAGGLESAQYYYSSSSFTTSFLAGETREEDEAENPIATAFLEHIVRALKLKANLVLSPRTRYTLAFPLPGEDFDPARMVRDGLPQHSADQARARRGDAKGGPSVGAAESGKKVRLCLFPALLARREEDVPGKEYGKQMNVKNCLVDCDNFVKGAGQQLGGFEVVVRGVVLV